MVMTCSALKRSYRDLLRNLPPDAVPHVATTRLRFVYLRGSRDVLATRLSEREGHFMPASLLESQLETLEEPDVDEDAWTCDVRQSPEEIVDALVVRATATGSQP